ncbi:MAG: Asp-tRNA(Asn)/Glu-tRNA(Gln) amidotransferase subunit GatB [Gammaproteobacteria bacterium]|nr:Asp-tRNA(Asn)/Glu-tRNA(Gln) amidotransferase subunit GatB [Gammaproteobacteria bacterium]
MAWEVVIGCEIHVQLATQSKIFSGASTRFGAPANSQACAVDLGFPGVLPVLNQRAVELAVRFGLAVGAEIDPYSVFARKNYFYPDLPKGYQISQLDHPIVGRGALEIVLDDGVTKKIGITRAHLEEDAGKSLHEDFDGMSGIDLNRAGTPLLEIVSEPDLRSAQEASAYMRKIHSLVRYLGISDGNMQEGSFRCDANISVRPRGQEAFGTRAEVKNLNSFRFVEQAVEYEVQRQIALIEGGGVVVQETRLYDPDRGETRSMRSKEEANDYRYFPDPDLLPVELDKAYIDAVRQTLPELPDDRRHRFVSQFGLSEYDASALTASLEIGDYFEAVVSASTAEAKVCANWITGILTAALNREEIPWSTSPVSAADLALLLDRIEDGTISGKIAKQLFDALWQGEGGVDEVIAARGLRQITDSSAIAATIDAIIADNPQQVEQYRAGKEKLMGFFVGQVMKVTQGKANPGQVNQLLQQRLKGEKR